MLLVTEPLTQDMSCIHDPYFLMRRPMLVLSLPLICSCFMQEEERDAPESITDAEPNRPVALCMYRRRRVRLTRERQRHRAKQAGDIMLVHKQKRGTHLRVSKAQSQTCQWHCACTDVDHRTPGRCQFWTGHPRHPRSESPVLCKQLDQRRMGTSRWQHHDNAPLVAHPFFLHVQYKHDIGATGQCMLLSPSNHDACHGFASDV